VPAVVLREETALLSHFTEGTGFGTVFGNGQSGAAIVPSWCKEPRWIRGRIDHPAHNLYHFSLD
jgi:hypothetical protein